MQGGTGGEQGQPNFSLGEMDWDDDDDEGATNTGDVRVVGCTNGEQISNKHTELTGNGCDPNVVAVEVAHGLGEITLDDLSDPTDQHRANNNNNNAQVDLIHATNSQQANADAANAFLSTVQDDDLNDMYDDDSSSQEQNVENMHAQSSPSMPPSGSPSMPRAIDPSPAEVHAAPSQHPEPPAHNSFNPAVAEVQLPNFSLGGVDIDFDDDEDASSGEQTENNAAQSDGCARTGGQQEKSGEIVAVADVQLPNFSIGGMHWDDDNDEDDSCGEKDITKSSAQQAHARQRSNSQEVSDSPDTAAKADENSSNYVHNDAGAGTLSAPSKNQIMSQKLKAPLLRARFSSKRPKTATSTAPAPAPAPVLSQPAAVAKDSLKFKLSRAKFCSKRPRKEAKVACYMIHQPCVCCCSFVVQVAMTCFIP